MDYDRPLFFHVMQYAEAADRDVIDMVSGNPDWDPPEALRAGLREAAGFEPERFQYSPSEGLSELRETIADRQPTAVDPESVFVTNGTTEANHVATACALRAHPGNEILLVDPVYPYYAGRVGLLEADARYVPAERDGRLDPDRVAEVMSDGTAVVVVNSPNNPTGAVYGEATKRALVELCEDHDACLVSDEVYRRFDHAGRFTSALEVDSPNRVVTGGVSKSMAVTGLRVGYTVVPERLCDPVRTRHMLTTIAASRPAQHATLRALRETPESYYERNRELVASRVETFTDALDAAGADYARPEGAFYVLARFEGFPGTMENAKRLVDEAGVAGMPGEAFGESRADWLRFALVTDRVDEAAARLRAYFGSDGEPSRE
jgi:aspartate/methionine/tyrosine aminotransferase